MNKLPVVLSVLLVGSVVTALMYAHEAQRERARAEALVERVFELEPVEKGGLQPAQAGTRVQPAEPPSAELAIESGAADVPVSQRPSAPRAVMEFEGTLRARKQAERLQLALVSGTPLQDYQIQALITAIDDVHREMQKRRAVHPMQLQTETREQIIQRAADILFESQLEVFIPLLHGQAQNSETQG